MGQVLREKLMAVPAEALFKAITEFEKYPDFLNEVVSAKVVKKPSAHQVWIQFEIELVKKFVYTLEFSFKDKEEIAWKLIESDFFKKNEGRWVLTPKGANETDVHYELEVGVVFLIPSWISKKLTEVNLPKMFDSFESRAKEIAKG
jgi:ribosome-associated toxin RatA of RatAB toxin-antitoxin module